MPIKFSVIIPTYNRFDCLKESLICLFNQDYPDYEIIVANDGSTDKTTQYLRKLNHPKLRVIYSNHQGRSQAKNLGISQSKGKIIAFIDDDCQAHKGWLLNLEKSFNDPKVVAAIGETRYVQDNYKGYFPEKVIQNPRGQWPMGGNAAFKKHALMAACGFDRKIEINEDTDLAFRIMRFGKLVKCPGAIVYHKKGYWTTKSFIESYKNLSIWAYFKKRYHQRFKNPYFKIPILFGFIVEPKDYLIIILAPILVPLLFIRFLINNKDRKQINQQSIKLFFLKWPLFFLARRYYLWKSAWQHKVFTL